MHRLIAIIITLLLTLPQQAHASEVSSVPYIKASLIIVSPGEQPYSTFGHCALRLECPEHQLDYTFSYETQEIAADPLGFLAGRFTMSVLAAPTPQYLEPYKAEQRGAKAYPLQLPPTILQRLWRQMDEQLGLPLPYDYISHGCAQAAYRWIIGAIEAEGLNTLTDPTVVATLSGSIREIGQSYIASPWIALIYDPLTGGHTLEAERPWEEKIIVPRQLISVLQHTTLQGTPIIAPDAPTELIASPSKKLARRKEKLARREEKLLGVQEKLLGVQEKLLGVCEKPFSQPMPLMVLLLLISAFNVLRLRSRIISLSLLALQSSLGMLMAYLLILSDLPATSWNWLIIPFSPLPLLTWPWRRYWARPYAISITLWAAAMILAPHSLVTPPAIPLALACSLAPLQRKATPPNTHL